MQTLESILAGHPFFKGLEPQYLQLITGCASNTRFGVGDYMFREGEDASQFYLIREGKVALEIFAAQYGPITIETIEAGEVLGWSWIFPPYRWHFSGHVMEPTRAIALDGTCLRSKGEADHDLGYELMKRVAQIMMRFTAAEFEKRGVAIENIYISMERNMKCAIGLCGHCQYVPHFVCKDGPVFQYSQIQGLLTKWEV